MLRASTHQSDGNLQVRLDVFGRQFDVQLDGRDGWYTADSRMHDISVFGRSKEQALSNLHFAVVCLAHIEAKRNRS